MTTAHQLNDSVSGLNHTHYVIRRKFFSFPHANFHVYDDRGGLILYARMKGFRLREDLRLYTDDSMARERLRIQTRSIVDFSAAYQVTDVEHGEPVGELRRRGFRSMLRDEWVVIDAAGQELAVIREDNTAKAVVRRLFDSIAFLLPQRFHIESGGQTLGTLRQNINPFVPRLNVRITGSAERLDRRLALAAGVLLIAIEGKQG